MATTTYTVVKGDSLWKIAQKYGTTVSKLVSLNPQIKNPDLIHTGQVIVVDGTAAQESAANVSSKAVIELFGLQADTDRTIFATWTWDRDNTENYEVRWYYATGDGVWFVGTDGTEDYKQSIYNAPTNAIKVKFKVKPISKTHTVNKKETSYWTAEWSTEKTYLFSENPPSKPSAPDVEIKDYKLTATLDNLDLNAESIQFQIVKDNETVFKTGTAKIVTGHAAYSCTVSAGSDYKVRCRSYRDEMYSDWSEYSDNVKTMPSAPGSITTCKAKSKTSVYLEWKAVANAETYDVEYATRKDYFDNSDQTTTKTGIEFNHFLVEGLETGKEYFFRVRAINEAGKSGWSGIKSVAVGTTPTPPTTWSSTTTVMVGEELNLYWVHNSEDGSVDRSANLELIIGGKKTTVKIDNPVSEDEKLETRVHSINTSAYPEGTQILWRVQTAGVTGEYGEWSIQRTIDVYAPPTLQLLVNGSDDTVLETLLDSFPINITAITGPDTQETIGYHLSIHSQEAYETVDRVGNVKMVNAGEEVYSKYFDVSTNPLSVKLYPNDLTLENNQRYTISCRSTMDSGLSADADYEFRVAWKDVTYEPSAEIGIDKDIVAAHIRPYCENEFGVTIEGITLSVYRREFDGGFTEIASGIPNSKDIFVTDPHPSLDFARYRIVATSDTTGAVSYSDAPGYPVNEKAVVIQWDEKWTNFETSSEDALEEPAWSGSILKLPYNIDVSNTYAPDVSLVEYIGRKHPVGYYGTQRGESESWKVAIPYDDKATLYALRRLAVWMGDVYVREPSGSGYWANITVSFSQKHLDLTIPVTIDIVRVEGGI